MTSLKFTEHEYNLYRNQQSKTKFGTPEIENDYASNTQKICSKCGLIKKLTEYRGNTSGCDGFDKDGFRLRRPECKVCTQKASKGKNEAIKLAKKIGIPYKAPEGTVCAVCNKLGKKGDGLVFDHCHKMNSFRGYLHNSCNRSIGVLGDDVEHLITVINFLNKTEKKTILQDSKTFELKITRCKSF